ncbi:MAG: ATPase [Deltaproteobacteria bacterium CG_4_10_14_3_um_filter_60_8]|nr:MAG: ATPase [Desulfobacterales bacterium CG2_30_60_27]PIP44166.1 MAG: ATPase [Deltaproteobacteria bacterium CG23_combo_of_CG06-09_8_20_14_all_60_8]PIY20954.1 MAG: ATPase [Deltaproteobacteria bacterium CG_4_10_14_3_um_filter_60_8]
MIARLIISRIEAALQRQAAVALIGPRQVGKTTLALKLAEDRPAIYLDLESRPDRDRLREPELFLKLHEDKLVILDEIHRAPELFQTLRSLIDQGRRRGKRTGRFLILGSASVDLLRQSSESLAGRIEYIDMAPLHLLEVKNDGQTRNRLWLRGGFPDSFLAANDADSFQLRRSFIRTCLERDVAQFGPRIPAETLERLWTMLAHNQATLLNASRLAAGLTVSAPTVTSYISLLVDLLLVRRLMPVHANVGKRLVKSPKTYVRDSGLVHALLGIGEMHALLGHPVVGASWEGFVIETLLGLAPARAVAGFYRTAAGAEIDLVLEFGGNTGTWAIEIKHGLTARLERGFYHALEDLQPSRALVVHAGENRYPVSAEIEAIGLGELAGEIAALGA